MTIFLSGHTVETVVFSTTELGQLACGGSLRDIVNIPKKRRQYLWDVGGWCTDTNNGIFLSIDLLKKKQFDIGPFI